MPKKDNKKNNINRVSNTEEKNDKDREFEKKLKKVFKRQCPKHSPTTKKYRTKTKIIKTIFNIMC